MREIIKSTNNSKVKKWSKLLTKKGRQESKLFLVEGKNGVKEATKAGIIKTYITTNPNKKGILVSDQVMKKITKIMTPQDVIAVCYKPEEKMLQDKILVLRNVQDPGNVGTLIRTAKAFGFTDVLIQGADPYSGKCLQSSQGAIFQINVIHTNDVIPYLNDKEIIVSLLDKQAVVFDSVKITKPFALILGNEGNGIDKELIDMANHKVYIPIQFESLNVSVAGGILMNHFQCNKVN